MNPDPLSKKAFSQFLITYALIRSFPREKLGWSQAAERRLNRISAVMLSEAKPKTENLRSKFGGVAFRTHF